MRTRRTTRCAQVLEAHAARGACGLGRHRRSPLRLRSTHTLLSSPLSLDSYTGDAVRCDWRLAFAVCLLARTPSRTLQRTRAHTAARIHARACRCLHAQRRIRTQHLSHTLSVWHTCAHTRTCTCTQPDRRHHTEIRDITGKTHMKTHTREHTQLPPYMHTHMNTHRHTKEHARKRSYIQTYTHRERSTHSDALSPLCRKLL
jgi:hypothetical protein